MSGLSIPGCLGKTGGHPSQMRHMQFRVATQAFYKSQYSVFQPELQYQDVRR